MTAIGKRVAGHWREIAGTFAFAAIVVVFVFVRQPFGLANNGDFAKLLGRESIWADPTSANQEFDYFVSDYRIEPERVYNPHLPSDELLWVVLSKALAPVFLTAPRYDLRILGAIHLGIFSCGVFLILTAFRRFHLAWRLPLTGLALLIFVDAEYTQFLNTAFMDAASIGFILLVFGVGLMAVQAKPWPDWRIALAFALVAALFLASKIQHSLCVVPLSLFCFWVTGQTRSTKDRWAWRAAPIALVASTAWIIAGTPSGWEVQQRFELVFMKLLPLSHDPLEALRELNRPPSELVYIGKDAFYAGNPLRNKDYRENLAGQTNKAVILKFYLHHPSIMAEVLDADLRKSAADVRVSQVSYGLSQATVKDYGVYRKVDDPRPGQHPKVLTLWSDLRRRLAVAFPYLGPLFELGCLTIGVAAWISTRLKAVLPEWPMFLLFSSIGLQAFVVPSLVDSVDTARHIVLYQVSIDLLVLLVMMWAARRFGGGTWHRATSAGPTGFNTSGLAQPQ